MVVIGRLNAFGFLVIEQLPGRGNYGFLDQVEALTWIRDNIANFGGNPNDVNTLFLQFSFSIGVFAKLI